MNKVGEIKSLRRADEVDRSDRQSSIESMGEVAEFTSDVLDELKIVHPKVGNKALLNVFRELRTRLVNKSPNQNFVCMVASVCHGGGASYIASNLAASFSLDKSKTSVLIDANLYDPNVERLVVGDAESGVTDYLYDPSLDIQDIVYATGIKRLRAIPIGSRCEGAAEYFSSQRMKSFMGELRQRYSDRYIFIDAPPIVSSSEAKILLDVADLVLIVVPYGKVSVDQVQTAVDSVSKDKLVGIVYNN